MIIKNWFVSISFMVFATILLPVLALAQQRTAYFMRTLPQSVHLNPATKFNYTFGLNLASFEAQAITDGFSYNDAIARVDGTKSIRVENILNSLSQRNQIGFNATFDAGLYLNFHNLQVGIFAKENVRAIFGYPKDLINLVANGNAALLDETLQIAPDISFLHTREFNVNLGHSFLQDKLRLGVNLKAIFGIGAIQSNNLRLDFSTGDAANYPVQLSTSSGLVNTGGVNTLIEMSNGEPVGIINNRDTIFEYLKNFSNMTFGLDVGATYQVTDKLLVSASILNISPKISWKNQDRQNFVLGENNRTNFSFDGLDIINDSDANTNALTDSLSKAFKFASTDNSEKFSSSLPLAFTLGSSYELAYNLTANALLYGEIYRGNFFSSLSLNVNKDLGEYLTLSLTYTADRFSFMNLGGGISINLIPLQVFVVSDNMVNILTNYRNVKNFSVRAGVSLVVGAKNKGQKKKKKSSKAYDSEEFLGEGYEHPYNLDEFGLRYNAPRYQPQHLDDFLGANPKKLKHPK